MLAATGGSLGVAASYTVALVLVVWIFGGMSGAHVNPAVTVALALRGRLPEELAERLRRFHAGGHTRVGDRGRASTAAGDRGT